MRYLTYFTVFLLLAGVAPGVDAEWNRFRGPGGSGVVDDAVPITYSATQNLKWRVPLPGKGVSSPVISGDRVYLTAYTGYGLDLEEPGNPEDLVRHLLAFDRSTGQELWRLSVPSPGNEDPYKGFITQHGYATSTPTTDGEHIYALLGKSGLFAVDRDGKELWRRPLGQKSDNANWGDGSSPVVVDGVVVVNAGILGRHVVGLDKETGETLWSIEDAGFNNSWSTPAVAWDGGKAQVLIHFPSQVMALDPRDGKVLWSAESPIDDATSSGIVIHDQVAYLMGSRAGHGMAIALGGSGDVSKTHTRWKTNLRAGITTPVIVDGAIFWASNGIFMAHSLKDGERIYKARLPRVGAPTGGFPNVDYSSPIVVDGHILMFTRNGESYVIKPGETFEVVSHNAPIEGDDTAFSATPAAADGELFVRSEGFLYAFAASTDEKPPVAVAEVKEGP